MNPRHLPPGQRRFVVDRKGVDAGDIVLERGPRIGERWWLVVDVEAARRYDHLACRRLDLDELHRIRRDPTVTQWTLLRPGTTPDV